MQTNIPAIASLDDIVLEPTIRPVTDDLDGIARKLHRSGDRDAAYAAIAGERFFISAAAGRALGFAEETERFLALAQTSPKPQVAACLDMLTALTLLNSASVIAIAIMPPQTGDDLLSREFIADSVDSKLRLSGDTAMIEAAALAFQIGPLPIAVSENQHRTFVLAGAIPSSLKSSRQGEPAMVCLEQGLSLVAFMQDLPQVASLVARAALQLDDADRIALVIADGDHSHEALDRLERARHGSVLLATVDLARACIYAGLVDDGDTAMNRALALAPRLPEDGPDEARHRRDGIGEGRGVVQLMLFDARRRRAEAPPTLDDVLKSVFPGPSGAATLLRKGKVYTRDRDANWDPDYRGYLTAEKADRFSSAGDIEALKALVAAHVTAITLIGRARNAAQATAEGFRATLIETAKDKRRDDETISRDMLDHLPDLSIIEMTTFSFVSGINASHVWHCYHGAPYTIDYHRLFDLAVFAGRLARGEPALITWDLVRYVVAHREHPNIKRWWRVLLFPNTVPVHHAIEEMLARIDDSYGLAKFLGGLVLCDQPGESRTFRRPTLFA